MKKSEVEKVIQEIKEVKQLIKSITWYNSETQVILNKLSSCKERMSISENYIERAETNFRSTLDYFLAILFGFFIAAIFFQIQNQIIDWKLWLLFIGLMVSMASYAIRLWNNHLHIRDAKRTYDKVIREYEDFKEQLNKNKIQEFEDIAEMIKKFGK